MPRTFTAFLSYAHLDADDKLSEQIKRETFDAITSHIHTKLGGQDFSFWMDQNNLRSGDDWRRHIHDVLAKCDFFVPVISPGFLRSDVCQEEFTEFCKRFTPEERGGRIIPILHREIPKTPEANITRDHLDFYAKIKPFQRADWQKLDDLNKEKHANELRKTADDIHHQICKLTPQATPSKPAPITSVDMQLVPPVSGYLTRSSQDQNNVQIFLRFSGPAHFTHAKRRIIFGIKHATLIATLTEGKITNRNDKFTAGDWSGPLAKVGSIGGNLKNETLLITAHDTSLKGDVLCDKGEGPVETLLYIDTKKGEKPTIDAAVHLDQTALVFHDAHSDGAANPEKMKAKLVKILLEKQGLERIKIPEDTDV